MVQRVLLISVTIPCWTTPISQPTKLVMAIRIIKWVFLISGWGYFTFFYGYTTHNREVGIAAPHAFAGYQRCVFAQNSHKATRNADSFSRIGQPRLSPQVLAAAFLTTVDCSPLCLTLLLTAHCCWPFSATPFCWLSFPLLWDLPSPVLPVSWEIFCTSPLCGFHTKTDKRILLLAPIVSLPPLLILVIY